MGDLRSFLIAFDLDGTLVDSRRDLAESANQLITERGGAPLTEEAIGAMVGDGAAVLVERALAAVDMAPRPDDLPRFLELYDARLLNHTRPYDGIPEVVRAARRVAQLAVVTNKPAGAARRILRGLDLLEAFDQVLGGDGPLPRKPDPAMLVATIEQSGVPSSRALFVGDSIVDLGTARRAGVAVCLVSFGFGFQTVSGETLADTEWVANDASELAGVIARFTGA